MQSTSDVANHDARPGSQPEKQLHCDFCGREAPAVRRVALDGDYERLRTRHHVQYACPDCSADKDRARGVEESQTGG